ncbi:MAG TPA: hypothetical protein VGR46_02765 [Candidatus Limnocylindria bacterium]|nr:hypothetical protein [Candidatus Limnocylindria bacterium]
MKLLKISLASLIVLALSLVIGPAAVAAPTFDLFGDATLVSPGHNSNTAAQLRSNVAGSGLTFGGVNFAIPSGMTLSQLTNLSTEYMFTAASCGGGSPRFQINIDGKNIHVYLGPPPNYTACAQNIWTGSGNLVTAASLVDTSQLPGGTFYDPWSSALAKYGTHAVTGIQLVTDSSWFFGTTQTVVVDNVMINATTETFGAGQGGGGGGGGGHKGDKEKCKKGGWMDFTTSPGPFRNQGQCVSHFARQGRNDADSDDSD